MADFDLNVDNLIQRLLENYKNQKAAEEHAQKLLVAQHLMELQKSKKDEQHTSSRKHHSKSESAESTDYTPMSPKELEEEEQRLLQQYALSPPSETLISEEGDQITVHHPREEYKKSKPRLRDFFVAEFGICAILNFISKSKKFIFFACERQGVAFFAVDKNSVRSNIRPYFVETERSFGY